MNRLSLGLGLIMLVFFILKVLTGTKTETM